MIDCGADWLKSLPAVGPTAIVLTHAHPDHAFGLAGGAPCSVYATEETWSLIHRYPVEDRRIVEPRVPFAIGGVKFEAFAVKHSIRAPCGRLSRQRWPLRVLLCARPCRDSTEARGPARY